MNWLVTIERTATIVAQTRSRLAGQLPGSANRLVSPHDPDARPIRKGRIDRPVELGYKAQVTPATWGWRSGRR
jgi:IS5 family transposase